MSLAAFLAELDHLVLDATGAFTAAADAGALEAARIDFLGAKSGRLKTAQKGLGSVPPGRQARGRQTLQRSQNRDRSRLRRRQRAAASTPAAARSRPGRSTSACPARRCGWAISIRSRRRSKSSKTSWAGSVFRSPTGPRSKTSGTTSRPSTFPRPIRPAIRWKISIWPRPAGRSRRRRHRLAEPPLLLRSQTSTVQIRVMEKTPAAGADHFAGARLSARHGRRHALSDVPPDRGPARSIAT